MWTFWRIRATPSTSSWACFCCCCSPAAACFAVPLPFAPVLGREEHGVVPWRDAEACDVPLPFRSEEEDSACVVGVASSYDCEALCFLVREEAWPSCEASCVAVGDEDADRLLVDSSKRHKDPGVQEVQDAQEVDSCWVHWPFCLLLSKLLRY